MIISRSFLKASGDHHRVAKTSAQGEFCLVAAFAHLLVFCAFACVLCICLYVMHLLVCCAFACLFCICLKVVHVMPKSASVFGDIQQCLATLNSVWRHWTVFGGTQRCLATLTAQCLPILAYHCGNTSLPKSSSFVPVTICDSLRKLF